MLSYVLDYRIYLGVCRSAVSALFAMLSSGIAGIVIISSIHCQPFFLYFVNTFDAIRQGADKMAARQNYPAAIPDVVQLAANAAPFGTDAHIQLSCVAPL